MKTYQDLVAVGESDLARAEFCYQAVVSFKNTQAYRNAAAGEAYYAKHNLTIEEYQKFVYNVLGQKERDFTSANYKLKTLFFRRLVTQQVQYVLGNGVTLSDMGNKEKLGKDFDFQLQNAAKKALAGGRAFGFWNYDHLEVFGYADTPTQAGFCPLPDEETAKLRAGIRFWFSNVNGKKIFRATLYEVDGITEYSRDGDGDYHVVKEKHGYITTTITSNGEVEGIIEENYNDLPIVPLYANDTHESELVGIRESIDAYDFVKSGLCNDIDEATGFYWILRNEGGMNDVDLQKFVRRMKTVKATVLDGDDTSAEAHTLDVPYQARQTMLEILRADIYEDFQALDVKTLSAAAKTTQEIQAAYQAQDNKCADFEYFVLDFVQKILELAGIDDNPTFNWNRVINQTEQANMILQSANYISDECIIRHLPFLTPEEAEAEIEIRRAEGYGNFNGVE